MKIEYKRDFNHNYLIIPLGSSRDYQVRMLLENNIPGILPVKTREWNGEEKLYYDISSKQPLIRMYDRNPINMEDLKSILYSLEDIRSQLKRYLIDESLLVVNPEMSYIEPGQSGLEWVIAPSDTDNKVDYVTLSEFILEHVNHSDNRARETAIEMHRMVKEDRFSIEKIIEYMESKSDESVNSSILMEKEYENSLRVLETQGENEKNDIVKESWFKKLCSIFKKTDNEEWLMEKNKTDFYTDESDNYRSPINNGDIEIKREDYDKTILISVPSRKTKGLLIGTGRDTGTYDVSGDSFIIGAFKERVDLYLASKRISRMHAKIYKQGDKYYLQDLNSSNGTQKNGVMLENNETVELSPGDEIIFADYFTYVFE